MKKIISFLLIAVLAVALSCAAFADYSYDESTGYITGSTEGLSGGIEHYVNGSPEGGATLKYNTKKVPGSYKIDVYENGVLVNSTTITVTAPTPTAPPTPTPTAKPTDTPEPTPTKEPEPTPTKEPEPTPTKEPEPTPTKEPEPTPTKDPEPTPSSQPGPVNPDGGNNGGNGGGSNQQKTDSKGSNVPKVGEYNTTYIVIAALSIAVIGSAVIVITKKYGKEN